MAAERPRIRTSSRPPAPRGACGLVPISTLLQRLIRDPQLPEEVRETIQDGVEASKEEWRTNA